MVYDHIKCVYGPFFTSSEGPWARAHGTGPMGPWDRAHGTMGPGPWAHGTGPMGPGPWEARAQAPKRDFRQFVNIF